MYFLIGLTVFGVFGSFTYYLPELFPTRLRGTGAGFCYNVGRVIAAAGPFLVGTIAAAAARTRSRRRWPRSSGSASSRSSAFLAPPLGHRDQGARAGLTARVTSAAAET